VKRLMVPLVFFILLLLGVRACGESGESQSRVSVSGLMDLYYSHNFNSPPDRGNLYRNFDVEDRSMAFSLMEVVFDKTPSPLGFHARLAFGKTVDIVHGSEPGDKEVLKHILQAYGSYKMPGERGATVDFGKFVTQHGAEVIETPENWNYSRGILFSWAIPYYHMGIRVRWPVNDGLSVAGYLVNGWNNVSDNNKGKTFGTQVAWTSGRVSVVQNWMGGPEQEGRSGSWRHLLDTTFTYNATDRLAFMLNHDYAFEDTDSGTVKWTGVAAYARYAVTPNRAFTLRYEWFRDRDGASTSTAQTLREITLTYEVRVKENFLIRYEARRDWSSQAVFPKGSGLSKRQTTLLVGSVVLF